MSATRVACRSSTPVSTVNRITSYGSVKRRLQFDDSPSRVKTAKIREVAASETPRKPRGPEHCVSELLIEDSPRDYLPSPICDADKVLKHSQLRPQNVTPVKRGTAMKEKDNVVLDLGHTTPRSSRQSKTDLYFSTFETPISTPTSTRSGLGTVPRTAEGGRYDRLCCAVKKAKNCRLPRKHEGLCEAFKALDRYVGICKAMSKRITFEDVQRNVERKTHKDFTLTMLSQIVGVYPTCYSLRYEEHRAIFGKKTPGRKYDLVLEPNLKDDLTGYWRPESPTKSSGGPQFGTPVKLTAVRSSPKKMDFIPLSPRKSPTKATPQQRELRTVCGERLEAWRAACRLAILRYKLVEQVRECQRELLEKIGESGSEIEEGSWHEKFDLESVPDPVGGELPSEPAGRWVKGVVTPVADKFVVPEVVCTNLTLLKSPEKRTYSADGKVALSPTKFAGDTPKLSLYERIMLKQKRTEERMAPMRVAREKRRQQLETLEDMVFSVWNVFARLKPKSTSTVGDMVMRIGRDCGKLSGEEIREDLEVLCEVAPRFFEIYAAGIHGHKYMRLISEDADDYQKVKQLITDELQKLNREN